MTRKKIAIIGGGVSGLYAAYLLEQKGITDYVLLEARDDLGGRIMDYSIESGSNQSTSGSAHFDLGPTWFWPDFQLQLNEVMTTFGVQSFAQYEQGSMVVERSATAAPSIMQGYVNSPTSMRLHGGMGALVRAMASKLTSKSIKLGSQVQSLRINGGEIDVVYRDQKSEHSLTVEHVFFALPPRLLMASIQFIPALPELLVKQWQSTATWMASHAKYIAVYDTPFWREKGLSGSARSALGPMVEIHDASIPEGQAALFGFLGVPAQHRKNISENEMKAYCRAQMARLFGTEAATPSSDILKDWSQDPLTATELDLSSPSDHGSTPDAIVKTGPWQQRVTGIGSEWSRQFPGYIAGAIEAADDGVTCYLRRKF
ncbi:flavin monoamine oxidase family protein [Marinomonas flavescens]|uniref:flavin monoamine oxidase family protein n=1 Tax=Marinomonas flavescens TaxID=2529379 RepID=UPI00105455A7|nr:FAD-dependent oxidoreductase [Marinomonas flavescens]